MQGIVGIITFLSLLGLSLVVTRLATSALSLTGLSWEAARFQARSAFTGTGFTTKEAERVVDHPVRRRIIMMLMVARSAGFVSIVISLILSFAGTGDETDRLFRVLYLVGGVVILWILARSRFVGDYLTRAIEWALDRWTDLDTRDYVSLLKLSGEYRVTELQIKKDAWLAGKRLSECQLADEGVTILGIYRQDGTYLGVPTKDTEIYSGDTLILYGRSGVLRNLDIRRNDETGEQAHREAVGEQQRKERQQKTEDREQKTKPAPKHPADDA
jgi:hypothetical protein